MMFKVIKNRCEYLLRKLNIVACLAAENLALREQPLLVHLETPEEPKVERARSSVLGSNVSHLDRMARSSSDCAARHRCMLAYEGLHRSGSPWQNACVERLNGSIRRECTDHVIVFGESHRRRVLRDYFDYYNEDRTHLGVDKETRTERPVSNRAFPERKLIEVPRVDGLHHRYEWSEAA